MGIRDKRRYWGIDVDMGRKRTLMIELRNDRNDTLMFEVEDMVDSCDNRSNRMSNFFVIQSINLKSPHLSLFFVCRERWRPLSGSGANF
jgi:hypothetical protein